MEIDLIAVVAGVFVISACCIAGFRLWAAERMLDIPNARSSHTRPTPRGGGIGIVISILLGAWISNIIRTHSMPFMEITAISLSGGIVALTGWIDDFRRLPYRVRLIAQVISSSIILIVIGYLRIIVVPFIGDIYLDFVGIPFTLLWLLGLTNAYNFMDGIDGIAGGQALIAGLGWTIVGYMSGETFVSLMGVLLAAASLGFLLHNWPPARIFMGDVGSAFIGFILAVLVIIAGQKDSRLVIAGMLLVWPFIFDAFFTIIRRMIHEENIFEAHRSHIYQRLVIAGYSHGFVTLVYMVLALIGVILAFLWVKHSYGSDILVILIPMLLFLGLWRFTCFAEKKLYAAM